MPPTALTVAAAATLTVLAVVRRVLAVLATPGVRLAPAVALPLSGRAVAPVLAEVRVRRAASVAVGGSLRDPPGGLAPSLGRAFAGPSAAPPRPSPALRRVRAAGEPR